MTDKPSLPRILYVDDDENLLSAVRRQQHKYFDLVMHPRAREGLATLKEDPEFEVVVADLQMPEMDGVEFLVKVAEQFPDVTRIMLTGNADLEAAKRAVNEGHIARFLTKPCTPEDLRSAIRDGIKLHRLVIAERELLEKTLHGAVHVVTDILGLVNPRAFGKAARVRRRVALMAQKLGLSDIWRYEIAAMFSQIGSVTVPPEVIDKYDHAQTLSVAERRMLKEQAEIGSRLIRPIPRLEEVSEAIRLQQLRYDGIGSQNDDPRGDDIPIGARLLKIALDIDKLEATEKDPKQVLERLNEKAPAYDPKMLEIAAELAELTVTDRESELSLDQLQEGMVISEDICSEGGMLLVPAGQEVSVALIQRLSNWVESSGQVMKGPIKVLPSSGPNPPGRESGK